MRKRRTLAQGVQKKITAGIMLCMMLITCFLTTSCVKQKNCEQGYTGKFVYLKETYKMQGKSCPQAQKKIVGYFFFGEDVTNEPWRIYGYVPPKFRSSDTVSVRLSYKSHCDGKITLAIWVPEIFFLTCIEEE
ncbi:MAG: hypothetical protein LBR36_06035 [Bacteroidales bacterium]|jgi:hypothetical protein|nr:hypothetical protein [Bacteroidales bacterium]